MFEENQRLHGRVRQLLGDLEEAEHAAARKVGTVGGDLASTGPEQTSDAIGYANHGLAGATALNTYHTKVKHGRFAPRDANGRFVSPKNQTRWQNFKHMTRNKNWVAKPGRAAQHAKWSKVGRWGGYGGGAVSAATSGLDQWASDSAKHPDMSTGEKAARTGTKAALSGAGAWAGAQGGAATGAALGALLGPAAPVGIVAGGLIGGIAGGIIGSEAGSKFADVLNDFWSDDDD